MYRAKCNSCGEYSWIFPDQLEKIKRNSNLKLHKYVPRDRSLKVNDKWFCIKCDASKKDGNDCFIYAELTGDKAKRLITIRERETNVKSMGFELPSTNDKKTDWGFILHS